jgi:hypothetical protein
MQYLLTALPVKQETILSSQDAALPTFCESHLLQFLLDWPLDERCLTQHPSFAFRGPALAALETGRLQASELYAVVTKFHNQNQIRAI